MCPGDDGANGLNRPRNWHCPAISLRDIRDQSVLRYGAVYIEDATSRLVHLQFVESEGTFNYFVATRAYLITPARVSVIR